MRYVSLLLTPCHCLRAFASVLLGYPLSRYWLLRAARHSCCSYVSGGRCVTPYFANDRMYWISCQICSSGNPPKAVMPVAGEPFLMIQKSWPSGISRIIAPQVKFLGGGTNAAPISPLPSPCSPWHITQAMGCAVLRNNSLPAWIDDAEDVSGFVLAR